MASEAQTKANRMNAQKSTGPRTAEGKETVSQNATKHGLCSCKNVIKGERLDEYKQFQDEMIEDLSPEGAMEEMLAERIVNLSWRLKRAEVYQNAVIDSISDEIFHESWNDCQRAKDQAKDGDMSLLLGKSIRRDFSGYKILEQLLVYERRIESSLYKATSELRKLQKLRQKKNEETAWAKAYPTNLRQNKNEEAAWAKAHPTNFRKEHRPKVTQPAASSVEPNTGDRIEDRREKVGTSKKQKLNTERSTLNADSNKQSQFGLDQRQQTIDLRHEKGNKIYELNAIT